MALINMNFSAGGSDLTETVLWTNESPTSNLVSQTVTLSDDLTKYKYLRIEWRRTTEDATTASMRVPTNEFKSFDSSATPKFLMGAGTTTYVARAVVYDSDTSVTFSQCRQVNGTGSSSSSCIPTKIAGLV